MPEEEPGGVDDTVGERGEGGADDGDEDHEDGEGEHTAHDEFAAVVDLGGPEEGDGNGDDCGSERKRCVQ